MLPRTRGAHFYCAQYLTTWLRSFDSFFAAAAAITLVVGIGGGEGAVPSLSLLNAKEEITKLTLFLLSRAQGERP